MPDEWRNHFVRWLPIDELTIDETPDDWRNLWRIDEIYDELTKPMTKPDGLYSYKIELITAFIKIKKCFNNPQKVVYKRI